jgi:ABC-type branched-subunit amino acid transport system ATPase component
MRFDHAKVAAWGAHRSRLARRLRGEGHTLDLAGLDGTGRKFQKTDILEVNGLAIHFGGVHALRDLTLSARRGEVTGIIGPNGAGKTTLFNCLSGLLTPDHGGIVFDGHPLHGTPLFRARRGLGRTFQTPRLFRSLSVLDNLTLGCQVADAAQRRYIFDPALQGASRVERAQRIADLVGYKGSLQVPAGSLAFGDLRVVELARSLCAAPSMLMLDEPASGLDVDQALGLVDLLRALAELGLGILLIEHDMSVVMGVCEQITVLDFGTVIARGTPDEVQNNQDVLDAYLGRPHDD